MNTMCKQFSVLALCGAALVACGDNNGRSGVEEFDSSDVGAATLAKFRLTEGEFKARTNTAECTALNAKLAGNRVLVRAQSEWNTVTETDEYKSLHSRYKTFKDGGCKVEDTAPTRACSDLEGELRTDAAKLSETPQWKTLDNNDRFHDLHTDWKKAHQIDCL